MSRSTAAAALLAACAATACSPTFNWREVRAESGTLRASLPCKPDKATRQVPMAGRQVDLHVLGCEAGGATFAVLYADIGEAGRAGEALAQWKQATLANMRATGVREQPFLPPGGFALREAVQVVASGQRADGSKVESHAAYAARGSQVVQAVIYSDALKPEMAAGFLAGLRLE
ncbi:hypothetical protein [uncultured Ramlibacter sp.]|uniref:hypothetical protein n=1 Tax=uncultured Ramlibacter sp. TaxID=260755 RepID=UPI002611D1DB|nr:hypothetical protein [uncultured Ramlibacter sp.]